jgi:hypothetical protein
MTSSLRTVLDWLEEHKGAVGLVRESVDTLRRLVVYLDEHRPRQTSSAA